MAAKKIIIYGGGHGSGGSGGGYGESNIRCDYVDGGDRGNANSRHSGKDWGRMATKR